MQWPNSGGAMAKTGRKGRETFTTTIEDSGWQDEATGKTVYRLENNELKIGTQFRAGNRVRVTVERVGRPKKVRREK